MMRRLSFACLALLALVAAGGSAAWYTFAGIVEANVDVWAARQRSRGLELGFDTVAVSGYPTVWNVALSQPRAAAASAQPVPWRWRGPDMIVGYAAWDPLSFSINAGGDHSLVLGLPHGDAAIAVAASSAIADIQIGADGVFDSLEMRVTGLTVDSPDLPLGLAAGAAALSARRHDLAGAAADAPSATVMFDGRSVALPPALDGPLGRDIAQLIAEADVLGVIPSGPADVAMAAWRDAGGRLQVRALSLHWGPVEIKAQGVLVLDNRLQPRGTINAQVRGLIDAVAAFELAGAIDAGEAAAARLLFTALSRPGEDGGSVIVLPIVIADQRVALGPLPLMRFPPIRWAR